MAIPLPSGDSDTRYRWVVARHNALPSNESFYRFQGSREQWNRQRRRRVLEPDEVLDAEPEPDTRTYANETVYDSEEEQKRKNEEAIPSYADTEPTAGDRRRQAAANRAKDIAAKQVKPTPIASVARWAGKKVPSLQAPRGRVGMAVSLFLVLLLLIVLLVKVRTSSGLYFTRWQLVSRVFTNTAVLT